LLFVRNATSLIILFNPGHNVASFYMNRKVGVLPKNYWPWWQEIIFLPLTKKCGTANSTQSLLFYSSLALLSIWQINF